MIEINNSMLNIIIGIVAIIVAIASAVFTYLQLNQNRKSLSYEIQSVAPVFSITKGVFEQLEIRLNGEIVQDAYIVIIKFANTGGASIKPEDFVRQLKVSIQNGKIISANISNTDPSELGEVIESREQTSVTFKKILLNRKDAFILQFLVSDFNGDDADINIDGRIEGVKSITRKLSGDNRGTDFSSYFVLLIAVILLISIFLLSQFIQPPK